jgi:2-polyprenyl-6-methoxyphenol hydroxylase-like FAD-dependent oxidoreductase
MLEDGVNVCEPGTVFLAVGRGGYVGMVRVEDGCLNVAAALHPWFIRQSGGLGPASVAVLHEAGCDVPQDLGDAKWRGTPHLTRRVRHPSAHRLFVLGDAAGYIEPLTGEGMAWALESGREAASLACDSIEHFDARSRARWERRHQEIVGRAQLRCMLIAAGWKKPWLMKLVVTLLAREPRFAMPVIQSLNAPSHREAYR